MLHTFVARGKYSTSSNQGSEWSSECANFALNNSSIVLSMMFPTCNEKSLTLCNLACSNCIFIICEIFMNLRCSFFKVVLRMQKMIRGCSWNIKIKKLLRQTWHFWLSIRQGQPEVLEAVAVFFPVALNEENYCFSQCTLSGTLPGSKEFSKLLFFVTLKSQGGLHTLKGKVTGVTL